MDQGRRKRRAKVLEEREKQPLTLFLDSSVLLSASGSQRSLSRLILEAASHRRWDLITASYCVAEVNRNVVKFGEAGILAWGKVEPKIRIVPNALVSTRPLLPRGHQGQAGVDLGARIGEQLPPYPRHR
jgi:hypothetical protein